ncbi:MAG: Na/Pi cotransporter family protein [Lentisphaeria bacterium]|nr:Na/Pi cotransporter family protein [Lentisphaeria bacterium]
MGSSVVGGLGIFMLGMKYMSDGLQATAGNRLRSLIAMVTNNRLLGVFIGTMVTCILQSSSVTTVMVVGFVNSSFMTLSQAIGVIMGANIGTTITGWILVLEIGKYGLPILGVGALFFRFLKNEKWRYIALLFMGLGMIFFGLELMKNGFKPIRSMPEFEEWFHAFSADTYLGIIKCALVGCVLTCVVQSSSATLGITISLAAIGVIPFHTAAALVMGENIGTTITAWLASLGTTTNAKRAAYAHIMFNVIGVAWIITVFPYYIAGIEKLYSKIGVDPNKEVYTVDDTVVPTADVYFQEDGQPLIRLVAHEVFPIPASAADVSAATEEIIETLKNEGKTVTVSSVAHAPGGGAVLEVTTAKVRKASPYYPDVTKGIALVHSLFNVVNVLLFLPFTGLMAAFLMKFVPEKKFQEAAHLTGLDVFVHDTPSIALEQSKVAIIHMGKHLEKMMEDLRNVVEGKEDCDGEMAHAILHGEEVMDNTQQEIVTYLTTLMADSMPLELVIEARKQIRMADEYESVSDYIANLLKMFRKMQHENTTFSDEGKTALLNFHDRNYKYLGMVNEAYKQGNTDIITKVHSEASALSRLAKNLRNDHLERLTTHNLSPLSSVIYTNMLNAYIRVKDHVQNFAEAMSANG